MAYSEEDRTWIRHFLGFSAIFIQADLRLENAIQASQSVADGGSRPDSSGENHVKGLIYGFAAVTTGAGGITPGGAPQNGVQNTPALLGLIEVERQLQFIWPAAIAAKVDEVDVDVARGGAILRREGRRLVAGIAKILSTAPRHDVFGIAEPNPEGDAFYELPDGAGKYRQW